MGYQISEFPAVSGGSWRQLIRWSDRSVRMYTTVSELRGALSSYFDDAAKTLVRLREAGMIPPGRPGRDGAGSARISPEQAATILLALLASRPIDSPQMAQQLAAYRALDGRRLIDWLAAAIERAAADPSYRVAMLQVCPGRGVTAVDPTRTELHWLSFGELADAAELRERLEFVPAVPAPRPERGPVLSLVVGPEAIRAAARAFAGPGRSTLLDTASQRREAAP